MAGLRESKQKKSTPETERAAAAASDASQQALGARDSVAARNRAQTSFLDQGDHKKKAEHKKKPAANGESGEAAGAGPVAAKDASKEVDVLMAKLGLTGPCEKSIFMRGMDREKHKSNVKHVTEQYPHYCTEIRATLEGLEQGKFGVRWLTLNGAQKLVVAERMALSMRALGEIIIKLDGDYTAETDVGEKHFSGEGDIAMVHGSFLWGEAGHNPGDLDLMVLSGTKPDKTAPANTSFGGEPPNGLKGDVQIGTKHCGDMDHLLNIPLFGERPDVTDGGPAAAWAKVSSDVMKLILGASQELKGKPTGKDGKETHSAARRKLVNCAVVMDYFMTNALKKRDPALAELIATANSTLTAGVLAGTEKYIGPLTAIHALLNRRLEPPKKKTAEVELSAELSKVLAEYNVDKPNISNLLSAAVAAGVMDELDALDNDETAKKGAAAKYPKLAKAYWT